MKINPQKENGHIDIANEISEALARTQLSGYESRYLWVLFRKTYGWHKKEDVISNSQFVKLTGLKKQHIWRTEKRLIDRNIVTKNGNKLSFNKIYPQWRELPKMVTEKKVTKNDTKVTNFGYKKVTKIGGHKRNYTKETIQKKIGFENFWNLYDKKRGDKTKLEKKWNALSDNDRQEIIDYLPKYKEAEPDKKFRKDPQTFLNNKSWKDELISSKKAVVLYFWTNAQGYFQISDDILQQYKAKYELKSEPYKDGICYFKR